MEPNASPSTMPTSLNEVPLAGYVDRLSGRAGDLLSFKLSSTSGRKEICARLVRSICADSNPAGPGLIEADASKWFKPMAVAARHQPFAPGSYAITDQQIDLGAAQTIQLEALAWPTLRSSAPQTLLSWHSLALQLDASGAAACKVGDQLVTSNHKLALRKWVKVSALIDLEKGDLRISLHDADGRQREVSSDTVDTAQLRSELQTQAAVVIAAEQDSSGHLHCFFNGKLEAPTLSTSGADKKLSTVASWDFARNMSSSTVEDTSANSLHATLVNYPARAMTGSQWQGQEMCWRHAPALYNAIHFHEDDIIDFKWETDFTFTIPQGMPSGVYVMRIDDGTFEDAIPFYVCAPKQQPTNALCVLIPTFTYAVYGNHARPDWTPEWKAHTSKRDAYPWNPAEYPDYGLSTYCLICALDI